MKVVTHVMKEEEGVTLSYAPKSQPDVVLVGGESSSSAPWYLTDVGVFVSLSVPGWLHWLMTAPDL